jgi:cytochrome c biogenesis protein CcdA
MDSASKSKRLIISLVALGLALGGIALLKSSSAASSLLWTASGEGDWLLPLVLVAALLDSVHPCSFSILLITIAFLFSLQLGRRRILAIGGTYVAGIFVAYLLIGLGLLKVLHLFDTPHFMGKLGASVLILFGLLNLLNYFFPRFPLKLKLPTVSHGVMGRLLERATFPAAAGLGLLVGICQFPCMGGPYLMVIGLLRDQVTYLKGFAYLWLYNLLLILPLVAVLWFAADQQLLSKLQGWKRTNLGGLRFWSGLGMIIIGLLILLV